MVKPALSMRFSSRWPTPARHPPCSPAEISRRAWNSST